MVRLELTSITGSTPFQIIVSDVYGNNSTLIATINNTVPPQLFYSLPSIFQTAPAIMLTIIDGNGCSLFKILECRTGCYFDFTINSEDCTCSITLEKVFG